MTVSEIVPVLTLFAIPSALTGFAVWQLKRAIEKNERQREKAEKSREDMEVILIDSVNASIALGEATATALKNGHCNGETEKALAYVRDVKHRQKDFLTRKGVENVVR